MITPSRHWSAQHDHRGRILCERRRGTQAGDLQIILTSPSGTCLELGGRDLGFGCPDGGDFPGSWNSTAPDQYLHTFDVNGSFGLEDGQYVLTVRHGFPVAATTLGLARPPSLSATPWIAMQMASMTLKTLPTARPKTATSTVFPMNVKLIRPTTATAMASWTHAKSCLTAMTTASRTATNSRKERRTVIPTKSLMFANQVLVSPTISWKTPLRFSPEPPSGTPSARVKKTRGCVKGTSSLVMDRTSGTSSRSQNHRPSA